MTDYYLTRDDNSLRLNLNYVQDDGRGIENPTGADLGIPNSSPENTILTSYLPQGRQINLAFTLINDGTDISNGTHTSTVVTINEQIDYIENTFNTYLMGVQYRLNGIGYNNMKVKIESINIDNNSKTPSMTSGTMRLRVGTVV